MCTDKPFNHPLNADARVQKIFETTGPMVKSETFKLMESVSFVEAP